MGPKKSRFQEKLLSYSIIGACLFRIFWLVRPTLNSGFLMGWDTRGHLLKSFYWAHELIKKGHWDGWFPAWHGGFPISIVYPPLFNNLMGIPTLFFDPNLVLNITAALLLMGLVPAMYSFLRSFGMGRIPAAIGSSLIILMDPPFTAGINSIYQVGLLPNSWGFILTILLLARINRDISRENRSQKSIIFSGFLLGALILSHTFSTYWFFIAVPILIAGEITFSHGRWRQILSRFALTLTIGFGLSLFWWYPFILNSPNMNEIEPMHSFFTIEILTRLASLKEGGGIPIIVLAIAGIWTLWAKKEKKTIFFLLWIGFITFHVALNTFNAILPFGKILASFQRVRFEGFYLWTMIALAANSPGGLELLIKKYKWPYRLTMLVAFILIQAFIVTPKLYLAKNIPRVLNNLQVRTLPDLAQFLEGRIKPGEFILSELNWGALKSYGTPHFLNQNLPLLSGQLWDLSGNLPESTRGSERAKILAQQMGNAEFFPQNENYLRERGVRYLVTLEDKTRRALLEFPGKFQLVCDYPQTFPKYPSRPKSILPMPAVFELKNFKTPFGLPKEIAAELADLQYFPPGRYLLSFKKPTDFPSPTTLALSYHPWLKIFADGKPLPAAPNEDHLLKINSPVSKVQKLEILFSPPPLLAITKILSGAFFLCLLFLLSRSEISRKFEKSLYKPLNFLASKIQLVAQIPFSLENVSPSPRSKKILLAGILLLFALFVFSRLYDLPARPMHNDEGVNSWFLKNLIESNNYKYDPENYHGPSLYYLQLIPTWLTTLKIEGVSKFSWKSIAGITPASIRVMVAIAGILILLGMLGAKNRIGPWGAIAAFILAGLSPDLLFFSRYFIHEILVVLFTLGLYLAATHYSDTKKPLFFYLSCLSVAFLFCTKETSVLYFLTLTIAYDLSTFTVSAFSKKKDINLFRKLSEDLKNLKKNPGWHALGGAALALSVWFLLYSSFFKNFKGVSDSILAYAFWTGTGIESGHNKPFIYFVKDLLCRYEGPVVFLSLIGMLIAIRARDKKGLFLSFWALGILSVHSFIPYKTPWLVINILLPMILLSGYAIQQLVNAYKACQESRHSRDSVIPAQAGIHSSSFQILLASILLIVLILSAVQIPKTIRMTYIDYDNEEYKQIYVHTSRDIYRLVADIEDTTAGLKDRENIPINIYSPIQWPLPFYLRNFKKAAWWGASASPEDAPIVIAQDTQEEGLKKSLKKNYKMTKYKMRPGVGILVYIDEEFFKNRRREQAEQPPLKSE